MVKSSEREEEFFARQEFERLKKAEEQKRQAMQDEEVKRLKQLHFMRCPKCGMQLVEIDYRDIKIDRCTSCNGVWLDAGELEIVSRLDSPAVSRFFRIFR